MFTRTVPVIVGVVTQLPVESYREPDNHKPYQRVRRGDFEREGSRGP